MINLIKALSIAAWAAGTGFLGWLAYSAARAQAGPRVLWGWTCACFICFVMLSILAYIGISVKSKDQDEE